MSVEWLESRKLSKIAYPTQKYMTDRWMQNYTNVMNQSTTNKDFYPSLIILKYKMQKSSRAHHHIKVNEI